MSKIIGIDLSSSGACAAVWDGGRIHMIPSGAGCSSASSPMTYVQIFQQLKADAKAFLNQHVNYAVAAVPAGFNMAQRQAVLWAGQAAGLGIRRLLNETTAASFAYTSAGTESEFLVCSLNGDGLSVSAISREDGVVEVLTCAWASLTKQAGRAQTVEETVRRAMKGIQRNKLSGALLAGDAVRDPTVRDAVKRCIGKEPVLAPGHAAAAGAAMQAGIIDGSLPDWLVLDALTPDVKIETQRSGADSLFSGDPDCPVVLPCRKVRTFPWDSDTELRLTQDGQVVNRFFLRDMVPAGWKASQVPVTFDVDPNGLVQAYVREPAAGQDAAPPGPAGPPPSAAAELPDAVEVVKAILPVYDNLERAMRQDTFDLAYQKGVEMTLDQLKGVLARMGVTEIDALGKPFDPNFHNAVMHIEDGCFGKNTVSQVFQAGFMLGDKVIRFAMVQVAN